jgi:glutamate synthase domain-containing protein 2/glutamate synthase domain-containing protein 1/glutamate synthase domain-containing protein 3
MSYPKKQGLYDPAYEKENCGIAFVANINGERSHEIICQGIEVLNKLEHRGACGSDTLTGDGAGLLIQVPHKFFKLQCSKIDIDLPEQGKYGTGLVFFPKDARIHAFLDIFLKFIKQEGLSLLGWRKVPVDNLSIGRVARESEPEIWQPFIGHGEESIDQDELERRLYKVRKQVGKEIHSSGQAEFFVSFYICSLSSRTFCYKGQLMSTQLETYFLDLKDPDLDSALSLVHSRYSTNTFPSWGRAQPMRFIAHNGEINTVQANKSWMLAREGMFDSSLFPEINKVLPVIAPGGSDSADFDHALEMLVMTGRSLPHAMMMMIPEPWSGHETMSADKKGFYEFHASMMEPWDGPASIAFTNGDAIGAVLDRNGLRPSRYIVTKDNLVVMASEVGVLPINEANIAFKGRLEPGKMLLVDLKEGRIITDDEIKSQITKKNPYSKWVSEQQVNLEDLPVSQKPLEVDKGSLLSRQIAFGYTSEDIKFIISSMIKGEEATGSMGNDTPLAVLSEKPQLLFHYFKQLFAQVTNPAVDSIREELVMSMDITLGEEKNLLSESPLHCRKLKLSHPILSIEEIEKIKALDQADMKSVVLSTTFSKAGNGGLKKAMDLLCAQVSKAIENGATIVVLSDRQMDAENCAIPSLLAVAGVHNYLLRNKTRTRVGLVIETGEPREMMHFALLIGYGAGGICPYLAYETALATAEEKIYVKDVNSKLAIPNYIKSTRKGLFKIIAKMGISTIQSYRGAQIFEAVGLNDEVISQFFTDTPSRVSGAGLDVIEKEVLMRHQLAYENDDDLPTALDTGGNYHWRRGGEEHMINPNSIALLQHATRSNNYSTFKKFSRLADEENTRRSTLRGLMNFKKFNPIPIEQVEPVSEITKRFCSGAMSIGSISREAHETLAIAMNRLGGKSNTGEGGEDSVRNIPDSNGDSRRSKIKQVASGRFGVSSYYLANADEIQIKVAQGAKPGEGGQLPGHKVSEYIAKIRNATPGVTLISPPPHHDIYSIEDLQQLIFDLHNANPTANVSVKLVGEVGVGTIAAGVSKARADGVLISGHDGGTGASPQTSIKHAGLPWELGLSETQQVLVLNDLRGRIRVQVDGQFKTGRDVVIGGLLGADEIGFSTIALITMGCIMMRKCHLNTCAVGVATQDPELRKQFSGVPDHVVNMFNFIAMEVREIMAELGFYKFEDLIGRVDYLEAEDSNEHWKSRGIDIANILHKPEVPDTVAIYNVCKQDLSGDLDNVLDHQLIKEAAVIFDDKKKVRLKHNIVNTQRAVGAMLSYQISKKFGEEGLPEDSITIDFKGSAGQSFGAFLARGVTFKLLGDANDYVGKCLSGGKIIISPPPESTIVPEENIIAGNVILYGATAGKLFLRGLVGERFCVRNSGCDAVVEGVGDHGCEYMTGGTVVVLGKTGRNFAAGMSGGIAFVMDQNKNFDIHCNTGLVDLVPVEEQEDIEKLKSLIKDHYQFTDSTVAKKILDEWDISLSKFVKVFPKDYRRVLEELKQNKIKEVA